MKINYINLPSNTIGVIVEYRKITEDSLDKPRASIVLNREIINQNLIKAFECSDTQKFFLPTEEDIISEITIVSKSL
jgi:hypothetical protein